MRFTMVKLVFDTLIKVFVYFSVPYAYMYGVCIVST